MSLTNLCNECTLFYFLLTNVKHNFETGVLISRRDTCLAPDSKDHLCRFVELITETEFLYMLGKDDYEKRNGTKYLEWMMYHVNDDIAYALHWFQKWKYQFVLSKKQVALMLNKKSSSQYRFFIFRKNDFI